MNPNEEIFHKAHRTLSIWAYTKYENDGNHTVNSKYYTLRDKCVRERTTDTQLVLKVADHGKIAIAIDRRVITTKYVDSGSVSGLGENAYKSVVEALEKKYPYHEVREVK